MTKDEKLSWKERKDIAIEAGIASIPTVGGALQTLYYGSKSEKRFKRIEKFYEELSFELESIKNQLPTSISTDKKEEFLGLLESVNDEVETSRGQSKIEYYKNAYKNLLINSNKNSYDNESFFIQILPNLTEVEVKLLYSIYQNKNNIGNPHETMKDFVLDADLVQGSLNRLNNYGLVSKQLQGLSIGGNNSGESSIFQINGLGSEFISFIFE